MDAKKFTLFLINFINSVIEKDETNYSWGHQFDRHNLITHHIGAKELEGYIFTIKEYNDIYQHSRTNECCNILTSFNNKIK